MAPKKRKCPPKKAPKKKANKAGRKPIRRQAYPLHVKQQTRRWHLQEGFKLSDVSVKLKKEMGCYAPDNTVCSWWSP